MSDEKERAIRDHMDAGTALTMLEGIWRRARDSDYASLQACCELAIERTNDVLAWTRILGEDYLDSAKKPGRKE